MILHATVDFNIARKLEKAEESLEEIACHR